MASALGGLVDAYVDSDEGEGEEAAQGEPLGQLAKPKGPACLTARAS